MRYWKRFNPDDSTRTVESYSYDLPIDGATEIDKVEFDAFIASLLVVEPEPPRDSLKELDNLKDILKAKGIL